MHCPSQMPCVMLVTSATSEFTADDIEYAEHARVAFATDEMAVTHDAGQVEPRA